MGIQDVYFKRWLPKLDSDDTRWQNRKEEHPHTRIMANKGQGKVYPRPQTTAITVRGGDKPRPYLISMKVDKRG